MRRISWFLLLVFISIPLFAQNQGEFTLSGNVVNSVTGEPIRNVQVTLTRVFDRLEMRGNLRIALGGPQNEPPKTAFAGPSGEFQFTGLTAGTYSLTGSKPGFTPLFRMGDSSAPRSITLSASMNGVQLKLAPKPAIEGKVVDQFGEPIPHSIINVYQVSVNEGARRIQPVMNAETNDRGIYRAHDLTPGKYMLCAMGPNGSTYNYIGDGTPRYESWEAYERVYWGGARDFASATPVILQAGSNAQADFTLKMQPAFRIRGKIEDYNEHQTVNFELRQGNEPSRNSRASINGTTGRFEVYDVVDGAYTLRGWVGNRLRGETQVVIKGANANNISLTLWPPISVRYAVHTLGDLPAYQTPPHVTVDAGDFDNGDPTGPSACSIQLRDSQLAANLSMQSGGGRDGTGGSISGIFPGEYAVEVDCFGGYPISAQAGAVDLLANPKIVIQPGAAPPVIEITARTGGGMLTGKLPVSAIPGKTAALLVPAAPPANPILLPAFGYPSETSSQFQRPFLAPGTYTAYALKDYSELEYRRPEVLQSLTGGISVKIEDGKTTDISLTAIQ